MACRSQRCCCGGCSTLPRSGVSQQAIDPLQQFCCKCIPCNICLDYMLGSQNNSDLFTINNGSDGWSGTIEGSQVDVFLEVIEDEYGDSVCAIYLESTPLGLTREDTLIELDAASIKTICSRENTCPEELYDASIISWDVDLYGIGSTTIYLSVPSVTSLIPIPRDCDCVDPCADDAYVTATPRRRRRCTSCNCICSCACITVTYGSELHTDETVCLCHDTLQYRTSTGLVIEVRGENDEPSFDGATVTTGTASGAASNIEELDGEYHTVTSDGGIDVRYQFTVDNAAADLEFRWVGHVTGYELSELLVYAWDSDYGAWDLLTTDELEDGLEDLLKICIEDQHINDDNEVTLRFVSSDADTLATDFIDVIYDPGNCQLEIVGFPAEFTPNSTPNVVAIGGLSNPCPDVSGTFQWGDYALEGEIAQFVTATFDCAMCRSCPPRLPGGICCPDGVPETLFADIPSSFGCECAENTIELTWSATTPNLDGDHIGVWIGSGAFCSRDIEIRLYCLEDVEGGSQGWRLDLEWSDGCTFGGSPLTKLTPEPSGSCDPFEQVFSGINPGSTCCDGGVPSGFDITISE